MFFSRALNDFYAEALAEGFARPGARHSSGTIDVVGAPPSPWAKIADELPRWQQTVLTTLLASCDLRLLDKVTALVGQPTIREADSGSGPLHT